MCLRFGALHLDNWGMKRKGPADATRNVHGSAGFRGFWAFTALPAGARLALGAVVPVGLLVDGVLAFLAQTPMPIATVYVGALIAIGTFAWRPPVAATVLVACGLVATFLGAGGPYSPALAVSVGVVTTTCGRWLTVSYCVVTLALAIVPAGVGQGLAQGGGIGSVAVGLASGLIGWGFRGGRAREHQLAADIDRLKRESTAAVQMERDRIADELHNIIAHDITTVVMQARALELVDDPGTREKSRRAITDAATQALTDIRRMLRLVQGTDETIGGAGVDALSLAATLESLRLGLGSMGASIELSFPGSEISISNSIETTLVHIAREAATNVMKHARQTPSIRLAVTSERECITLQVWNAPSSGGYSGVAIALALLAMLVVGVFAAVLGGTPAPFSFDSVAAVVRSIAAVALASCFGAGLGYAVRSATVAAIVIITVFWLAPITLLIAGLSGVPGATAVANITTGILVGQAISATPEPGDNFGPWGALLLLTIWSSGVLLLAALRLKGK